MRSMVVPKSGGGSAVGIDPEALGGLITDAESRAGEIEDFVGSYNPRFYSEGVSTTNLTSVDQVAQWVRDQIPMLKRRKSLAEVAANQSGTGFVSAGAGELRFETQEAAAEQGKKDAERLLGDIEPGDDVPTEVYELLLANGYDADYLEAFYNEVGAEGVAALRVGAYTHDELGEFDDAKLVPLSVSLGTASFRIDLSSDEWLDAYTIAPSKSDELAPLLRHGYFAENILRRAMDGIRGIPIPRPDSVCDIMNALARNDIAAAHWYQDNADGADMYMQGRDALMYEGSVREAFANVMESATIDVRGSDQALGEQNTLTLLEHVNDWGDDHAQEEFQQFFGELIKHDIDDVYASTTAPVPEYFSELRDDRDGVEATADLWAAFTEEAMRDMDVAGSLSVAFSQEYYEHRDPALRSENPDEPNANNLTLAQTRYFSDWFVRRSENVQAALDMETEEWNNGVDTAIDNALKLTDPRGLAVDLTGEVVKAFVHKDKPDYDVDVSWASTFSESLRHDIAVKYDRYQLDNGQLPPVTVNDGSTEITWEGDPTFYEELYDGDFTNSDGTLKTVEEMSGNDMRAYQEWMQDPAVQNMFWDDFSADMPSGLQGD